MVGWTSSGCSAFAQPSPSVLGRRLPGQRGPAGLLAGHPAVGVVGPDDAADGGDGGAETFLAAPQGKLGAFAVVDVAKRHGGAAVDGRVDVLFDPAAGQADGRSFHAGVAAGSDAGLHRLIGRAGLDAREHLGHTTAEHVGGPQVPHLQCPAADIGEALLGVDRIERLADRLEDVPQRHLGPLGAGDVDMHANHAQGAAVGIPLDLARGGDPADAAAGQDDAVFGGVFARPAGERRLDGCLGTLTVIGVQPAHPVLVGFMHGVGRQAMQMQVFRRAAVAHRAAGEVDLETGDEADPLHPRQFGGASLQSPRGRLLPAHAVIHSRPSQSTR